MNYAPYAERIPDTQYLDTLRLVLTQGEMVGAPHGIGALTYMAPPPMRFKIANGAPLITERKIGFWRKPIGEILAFINGARTLDELDRFGCRNFWETSATKGKCAVVGLPPGDLGPGSYGAAFANFPMPDGSSFNQIRHVLEQLRKYPNLRTHVITPWIPYYIGRGGFQKAVTSPCHGWMQFKNNNGKLTLIMYQRSADLPIGVPSNIIQYAVLLMVVAHVLGLEAYEYIHVLADAHIYENQIDSVTELLAREPRRFPTVTFEKKNDLFSFRPEDFTLSDYDPHPAMPSIPFLP